MVKVGDLIYIKRGTSDFRAPDGALGLVVKTVWARGLNGPDLVPGVVEVFFMSGEKLRFHRKWLEVIDSDDEVNTVALSLADAL